MKNEGESRSGAVLLVIFNIRRTFTTVFGLFYIIIGIALPIAITIPISSAIGNQKGITQVPIAFSLIPAILPMFAVIGSMGVAYFFSTDRSNGLYEYLIATRKINISDIFLSYSIIDAIIVSVILGVDLAIIYIILTLKAPSLLHGLLMLVIVYSIPVAYFASILSVLAMLTWSSLSKKFAAVNAPGGIGSVIGLIPPVVFLLVGVDSRIFAGNLDLIGGLFSIVIFGAFIILLIVVLKLMSSERMLA